MRVTRRVFSILPAMALLSAQAPAPNPSGGTAPIVIEGDANRNARIHSYVETLSRGGSGDTIARFEKPVCPLSFGLADSTKGPVEARLRKVVAAAGVKVASPGCAANVLLFVSADPEAMIAKLRKERPALFGPLTAAQVQAIGARQAGATAWHLTETRGADGRTLANQGNSAERPTTLTGTTSSRLLPQTRTDLDIAVVVLDAGSISGATITQLADYVAMRALTGTNTPVDARLPAPTILSLLEDKRLQRPAPMSLTNFDLAYLKSLYAMPNAMQATIQRGQLEQLMRRNLATE